MKSNRRLAALLVAATVAATVAACSKSNTPDSGGDTVNGAFQVSTTNCPADATTALANGATLKIGTVWPLSGPYAALGVPIVAGMRVAIGSLNDAGGVGGHKLELDAKDDGYDPTKTPPLVTELLQKDDVFATLGQAGTANIAAVQPLHEQACVPQLFVGSGAPQFGDPARHPWTSNGIMAYTTEAQMWADYIKQVKPGAKVAYLSIDNDSGKAYSDGFTPAAQSAGLTIVASEKTAPTATTVDNEVTNLLAAKPDVIVLMSVGASCAKAMGAMAQGGFKGLTVAAYTCAGPTIFPTLGAAAEGAVTVSINKLFNDQNDPDIQKFRSDVAKYGQGQTANDPMLLGYRYAMLFADTVTAAAALPGGLSRANLMNAAWNLNTKWFAAWGGGARTSGTTDPYVLEAGRMLVWHNADKALVPTGDVIDREGKTGSYSG